MEPGGSAARAAYIRWAHTPPTGTITVMSLTVDRLLVALEPLPYPKRLGHLAHTVRSLPSQNELVSLVDELAGRGIYERRLAAFAALVGRHLDFLAERLTDRDRAAVHETLNDLPRLRNEQDPVRCAALNVLSDVPPDLFHGSGHADAGPRPAERMRGRFDRVGPLSDPATVLAAATRLTATDDPATGLLAVALVSAGGPRLGWPDDWRGALHALRTHPSADVRDAALEVHIRTE